MPGFHYPGGSNLMARNEANEVSHCAYAHLRHHAPAMDFDGFLHDSKFCGNLFIEPARDNPGQHLAFAGRKTREMLLDDFSPLPLMAHLAIALQRLGNGSE